MTAIPPGSAANLPSLDEFVEEQGTRDAFQAVAIKQVLTRQIKQVMESEHLSRKLAEEMGMSRSQICRLLDPSDGSVT